MMTTGEREGLNLDDEDRLPWLEPAEDDMEERVSPARIAVLVLLGLALLGLIVGGGYWLKTRDAGVPDEAKLIPAQGGDYKLPANAAGGKTFDGEGDTSFAASEGMEKDGKVDPSRTPEAPLAGVSRGSIARDDAARADVIPAKPATRISATVKDETKAAAASGTAASAMSAGTPMIQLGAYGSDAGAREAWGKLSQRFSYLSGLSSSVEKAQVGGATLYRLRAGAGTAANAATLCGRLKVAGESCIVVR